MRCRLAPLLLAAAPFLCAAAPLPPVLDPPQAVVGRPLRATVALPDTETILAGLPSLSPFELLAPPRREGNELHLLLLPMRPGRHTLPALPLHRGHSGQMSSAPLTVDVVEGIPDDAEAAPLKTLPAADDAPPLRSATLLALAVAAALACLYRRRLGRARPRPHDRSDEEALLAELQRRLEPRAEEDDRLADLALRLERLRFAPAGAVRDTPAQLRAEFLAVTGEER